MDERQVVDPFNVFEQEILDQTGYGDQQKDDDEREGGESTAIEHVAHDLSRVRNRFRLFLRDKPAGVGVEIAGIKDQQEQRSQHQQPGRFRMTDDSFHWIIQFLPGEPVHAMPSGDNSIIRRRRNSSSRLHKSSICSTM